MQQVGTGIDLKPETFKLPTPKPEEKKEEPKKWFERSTVHKAGAHRIAHICTNENRRFMQIFSFCEMVLNWKMTESVS